jgi:hypothetical protein
MEMTDDARRLEDLVVTLMLREKLDEAGLNDRIEALRAAFPVSDEEADLVRANLLSRLYVEMDLGVAIVGVGHTPWLDDRRQSVSWSHWDAYKRLLILQRRPLRVIDRLSQFTDEVLDLAGDPTAPSPWMRKGLVIGEVQSGKTSTYLGLIGKAADVGYRLFIVIGGHTEKLRQQTQERIDEGFVGRDSAFMIDTLRASRQQKLIGVGPIDASLVAHSFTTVASDFSTKVARSNNFTVSAAMTDPIILVVKKNKTVLNNLAQWLRDQATSGQLATPLMLIDDEADYASINTKEADDPTAINQAIRDLLAVSSKSSYVAFTATPFANVLIDDEDESDLFPSDYIYALESPSNYMGPEQVFDPASDFDGLRTDVEDAEVVVPFTHKSTHLVDELPDSLRRALQCYFIANAIIDLRGEVGTATSMLVNVSRFNRVQDQIFQLVTDEVSALRNAVELAGTEWATQVPQDLLELKATFDDEYSSAGFAWSEVQAALPDAVRKIDVVLVNSKTTGNYARENVNASDRYVAVGGAVLSRGLTLDGLVISYFYQRARASDTLLQMGRWFGYRDGYAYVASGFTRRLRRGTPSCPPLLASCVMTFGRCECWR